MRRAPRPGPGASSSRRSACPSTRLRTPPGAGGRATRNIPAMHRPLHLALTGRKFMGREHSNARSQAPHFFDLPRQVVLDTIAARDADELASFADRWCWRRWTARWQDLIEDPDVELVDVGTPNP